MDMYDSMYVRIYVASHARKHREPRRVRGSIVHPYMAGVGGEPETRRQLSRSNSTFGTSDAAEVLAEDAVDLIERGRVAGASLGGDDRSSPFASFVGADACRGFATLDFTLRLLRVDAALAGVWRAGVQI